MFDVSDSTSRQPARDHSQTVKWPSLYIRRVCILDVIFDSRCLSVLLLLSDALPVRISTQSLVSCYLSLYTSWCLTNIRQRPLPQMPPPLRPATWIHLISGFMASLASASFSLTIERLVANRLWWAAVLIPSPVLLLLLLLLTYR
jgi:hypothetical protein